MVKNRIFKNLFIVLMIYGVILHIIPYFFDRSLWLDEAMLVSSIIKRSLFNLTKTNLDYGQNAPIGYLYIVKILTMIFSDSKCILRIWSLITCFMSVFLIYKILKNKVNDIILYFVISIFFLNDSFIYFSNEVKPYMSDNFFTLLTLYLYTLYKEKRIKYIYIVIYYSIILWFSFSSVFFIASIMITELYFKLSNIIKNKNYKLFKEIILSSLVLFSFIVYYFCWLKNGQNNAGDKAYWDLLRFPIIPKSINDFKLIFDMIRHFLGYYVIIIKIVLIISFVTYTIYFIKNKNDDSNIFVVFLLALILCLVASSMGFYPIQNRLVQNYGVVLLIITGFNLDKYIYNIDKKLKIFIILILSSGLILHIFNASKNLYKSHVYLEGYEVDKSIEYLVNNIKDDDSIYVYSKALPVFEYETRNIKKFNNINIIKGEEYFKYYFNIPYSYDGRIDKYIFIKEVKKIVDTNRCYIFSAKDSTNYVINELIEYTNFFGNTSVKSEYYGDRLYYFESK